MGTNQTTIMPKTEALRSSLPLTAFLIAGTVIGLLGVVLFGAIHAVIIIPIWTRLLGGIPFGLVAGLAMGWALYELRVPLQSRARVIITLAFGVLLWATLIPMTLFGVMLRVTGMHGRDNAWEVLSESVLAVGTGGAAGRLITGRWRAALALGAASLAATLTQAGPLPVTNSVRAAWLFAALTVVYVVCGLALGFVASLVSQSLRTTA